ncbi:MAG: adenylate/guanylate cyclase domain-containing protein [Hyphomicrobiales bacterium]|nr:adenylate/guanylate cyclase domain-containing protein [Hyphomicrobiales bacterium]
MKQIDTKTAVILSLVVTVIILPFTQIPPLRTFEARYADLLMTYLAEKAKPSQDIVIVKITEDTLAKLPYRSPIDRGLLADILEKILASDPKAVGVDLILDQPSEKEKDDRLLSLLEKNQDRVFVVYADQQDGLSASQEVFENKVLENVSKAIAVLPKNSNDGIVRHFLEGRVYDEIVIPALAHAVAGTWKKQLSNGHSRIVYQHKEGGKSRDFPSYPANAVKVLPPAWFTGKYVLIGVDLPFVDRHRTPFSSSRGEKEGLMPGVFIHAHILDQLLSGIRVTDVSGVTGIALFWIAGIVGLMMVRIRRSIWTRIGLLFIGLAGWIVFSLVIFETKSLLIPTVPVIATMIICAMSGSAILWQSDRLEKRFVRDAWSHYVSPDVVRDMISNPEKMALGGEQMDVSFIFTDIAGFTSMSENMPVEQLSTVLNDYLDRVSAEFVKAGATLDKFVGDAVIGFIGAPIPDSDHPNKAVSLAIAIDSSCRRYQAELAEKGIKFGHTRIGVHSGPAIIGNFGGSNFFDYTALGDTVNTASRLEGANKNFASHICISGATVQRTSNHEYRPLGRLLLAGKSQPVDAWEPVIAVGENSAPAEVYRNAYAELDKGTISSLKTFKRLAKQYPEDYLVNYYLERLGTGQNSTLIDLTGGSNK